ncbi:MAG: C-GCAxxG-C-C family protein [Candidatus Gastranaerophilales bacterium]|nr:C-GCAxxG-C-C family protein [Candidatus Gastranaerophilales bacterium]
MSKFSEHAQKLYAQGYSCSESIVRAAIELGMIDGDIDLLTQLATPFSGGLSSGCLCGAISGSQIVVGLSEKGPKSRVLAKKFVDEFTVQRKATCCRVLSRKFDFNSPARKENCSSIVGECAKILEKLLPVKEEAINA